MNTIMHNMLAMNAQRQLNINTKKKAQDTERLSSGYRINRAADDAAGLSISEKMRSQIRGLNQGAKNTEDGISLCRVADGALAEVTEILHRITELSVQSANGTNTEQERRAIQQEISELMQEIDRIGDTTEFNRKKIFDGNGGRKYTQVVGSVGGVPGVNPGGRVAVEGIKVMTGPHYWASGDDNMQKKDAYFDLLNESFRFNGRTVESSSGKRFNATWCQEPYDYDNVDFGILSDAIRIAYDSNRYASREEARKALEGATFTFNLSGLRQPIEEICDWKGSVAQLSKTEVSGKDDLLVLFDHDPDRTYVIETTELLTGSGFGRDDLLNLSFKLEGDYGACTFRLSEESKNAIQKILDDDGGIVKKGDEIKLDFVGDVGNARFTQTIKVVKATATLTEVMRQGYDSSARINLPFPGFRYYNITRLQATGISKEADPDAPGDSGHLVRARQNGRWWIQSGANPGDGLFLEFEEMDTEVLGLKGLDASTEWGAGEAITRMAKALKILMSQRTRIGVQQNRLEHIYQNVTNASENTQSAESRILDADLAEEMVSYARDHILGQVGEAMLAQTNQSPRRVLSLLQSI